MTVQPFKNEQAVAPMVSNQTTPLSISQSAKQAANIRPSQSQLNDFEARDVISGAATAPASGGVSRLTTVQNDSATRMIKAEAIRTGKAVEEQLESMQEKSNEIVNSYPPFLRGSEKRQEYLMSISSIRHQIEAMTIPPSKFTNSDLIPGSQAKKIWSDLFQGVTIPALPASGPNEASDAEIKAVSSVVSSIQKGLVGRRSTLEQQAASPVTISPNAAQYISRAAGQGLTNSSLSLTSNLTGALKGL